MDYILSRVSGGDSDNHREGRSKFEMANIRNYLTRPKISVLQRFPTTFETNHYHYRLHTLRFPSIMNAARIMLSLQIVIVAARSSHPGLDSTGSSIRQRRFRTHRTRRPDSTRCMSICMRTLMRGSNRHHRSCLRFYSSLVWRRLLCGVIGPRSKPPP